MERLADLERHPQLATRFPALQQAVAAISSPPLREMGTLGGNLCLDTRCTYYNQNEEWRRAISYCMKAEGKTCWVAPSSPRCWAVQSADTVPMLIALGARVRLVSLRGERELPLEQLYRDDGIDYLTKDPDELVESVLLPEEAASPHCRSSFFKLRRRGAIDFGVLSVAAAAWFEGRQLLRLRLVLGSVGSAPVLLAGWEDAFSSQILTEELMEEIASQARKAATPMDNTDLDPIWRGQVLATFVRRTLRNLVSAPGTE
jgi:4-hydroxybenzoyl-CoA reductase subunit beta